jgi:hypothetical protein
MENGLTLTQQVAICFTAGVIRDNHGIGRKGDHRNETVSIPEEREKPSA